MLFLNSLFSDTDLVCSARLLEQQLAEYTIPTSLTFIILAVTDGLFGLYGLYGSERRDEVFTGTRPLTPPPVTRL